MPITTERPTHPTRWTSVTWPASCPVCSGLSVNWLRMSTEGVAQVVDDLGNPLVFTAREVLGHSSQLVSICLSTVGFVALLNTVITPMTSHPDGHTSALLGHEHGILECTRIAKGDCARGRNHIVQS